MPSLIVIYYAMFIHKGNRRSSGSEGESKSGEDGKRGGRTNCGWNVMYEKRIIVKKTKFL